MAKSKLWQLLTSLQFILVFMVFNLSQSVGSKILVVCWPNGRSHFKVLEKIGKELETRGHEVVFLLSSMENYIDKVHVNKEVYQVEDYPVDYLSNFVTESFQKHGDLSIWTMYELFSVLGKSCEAIFADKDLLAKVKDADLLLADGTFACGAILAEYLSIPRVDVAMWSFMDPVFTYLYNIPNPLSYVPQGLTGFSTKMSFTERAVNVLSGTMSNPPLQMLFLSSLKTVIEKYKIGQGKSLQNMIGQAQLVLVPTDFALEWARPILPTTKVIGSVVHSKTKAEKLSTELEDFMQSSSSHGVVVVSFGSNVGSLDNNTNKILATAFSRLKQKVIWRVAGPVPKNLGANTKTMKWLPQFDLLGHSQTRVFVSHCGMNGMNEGAFHGVPVLAMPLYGDQLNNAQQLVHAGMAIAIFRKRFLGFVSNPFNADDVVQAIEQLMHDPRYKDNALRVSRLMKDRRKLPAEEGADWVEYVLRHNGTAHLRPQVFELNWVQYYLLDVILFLIACVAFISLVCVMICKCCFRLCSGKKDKEKQH